MISLFPNFLYAIIFKVVSIGWPTYQTWKILYGGMSTQLDLVQWTTYWILYALLLVLNPLTSAAMKLLPFSNELHLLFIFWLVHPQFLGAAYLWLEFFMPHAETLVKHYEKDLEKRIQPFIVFLSGPAV
eukprot:Selendium_serpulae@DN6367_c0_g4_i1.p1